MKSWPDFAFARHNPAAVLRIRGDDALTFLQGQFTQELRQPDDGVAYGLWLDRKGKIVADSFVFRAEPGAWWLVSYFSSAAVLRERLEAFIIADDVTVEDLTPEWEGAVVLGERATDWATAQLGRSPAAGRFARLGKGFLWRGRRGDGVSWEWLGPRGLVPSFDGAAQVSAEDLERWRIAAGVPAVPRDAGPGDLPNEAGLETEAISYTKGCYLGQEVMARLKSMGQVRRRLIRVRGDGTPPAALPAKLFLGEKSVGEVRSAISANAGRGDGWIGLAMISLLGVPSDAAFSLGPGAPAGVQRADVFS